MTSKEPSAMLSDSGRNLELRIKTVITPYLIPIIISAME
jgi:hypothetical protein